MTNTSDPSASLKVAALVKSGEGAIGLIERAEGVFESHGIGNSYLITTDGGDVLVNAGALKDARQAQPLFAQVSKSRLQFIVLTQSHANQYGGLEVFKTPDAQVIAHRIYPEDRRYSEALGDHYRRGSRRIFGTITGRIEDLIPTREVSPDILIDDCYRFELGARQFEILWAPGGETRSGLVVWLPREKIAFVGNLFGPLFGNQPNLNTLRGDKPRSALEFIRSAKRVRDLRPQLLLTGHEAIEGVEHIQKEITRIVDAVQWMHDRTIQGMNEGLPLHRLMHDVKMPPELALTEEYGKVAWNVRAIWHEYTGWFDPSRGTTELFDVPASSVATAIVELSGGTGRLAASAAQFVQAGQPLQALHLIDIALAYEPTHAVAREVKREALTTLSAQIDGKNLWERMWIAAQLRDLN